MYLAESKVETYIHVNIQCNIFDVRLSFNLLEVITVLLKCILENCLWKVMIFQKLQTLLKVLDVFTGCCLIFLHEK